MKLAEMTVDEAIAVACREVAECCPPPVEVSVDFKERTIGPEDRLYRAVWFDAAYETLPNNFRYMIRRGGTDPNVWYVFGMDELEFWELLWGGPTKYHALAAALLLAAGKEIP